MDKPSLGIGFNSLKTPMLRVAREFVRDGGLAEVRSFQGIHAKDDMADARLSYSGRFDPARGGGALADIARHIIVLARDLLGPVIEVDGRAATLRAERPDDGGPRSVEVDDVPHAQIILATGMIAMIEASWVATERTTQLGFNGFREIDMFDVVRSIAGENARLVEFGEGVAVLRVVEAIHRSTREGGSRVAVTADRPGERRT